MQDSGCVFGIFFRQVREAKGVSLWQAALKMAYHIRNLQRIERGRTQPGVNLALRLLDATGIEPGTFMQEFVAAHADALPASISPKGRVTVTYEKPREGPKSLFGPLLAQARLAGAISQTAMAKAAGYTLSNINAVEKGRQEPGIMTALALVMTTGVDVREFFTTLHTCWREQQASARSAR